MNGGVRIDDNVDRAPFTQAVCAKELSQRPFNPIACNGVSQPFSHRQSDSTVLQFVWKSKESDASTAHTSTLVVNRPVLAARRQTIAAWKAQA